MGRSIQHFADVGEQLIGGKGLVQKADPLLAHAVFQDRIVGVTGHIKRVQRGHLRSQGLRELPPTHPRHDNIGQQKVNRAGVRRGRLPASLRALMFWTDDWHRTSEWYSWSLPV